MMQEQLYHWRWRKHKSGEPALPESYGELFRVICRSERNSCPIAFLSYGWRVVTSRNALRKMPADA
jgi:hypothetical protein